MFIKMHYSIVFSLNPHLKIRYRAGPEIGYVVENLEEVNARSVQEDCASNIISASRKKDVLVSPPVKSQESPILVGSGVLPPKTSPIPTPNTLYSAPLNTYETIR